MQVNHFNTFPYGGAAAAALRLHHEMQNQRIESRFWYSINDRDVDCDGTTRPIQFRESSQPNFFQRQLEKRRNRKICRLYDSHLANRDKQQEVFSMAEQTAVTRLSSAEFERQIVHLHWVAFMADLPSFFRSIPRSSPIVWTLHDMNPLTGGCHYSSGCEQFKSGCGSCPQVVLPNSNDASAQGFRAKQKAFSSRSMNIVSPSLWLKRLAESSPIFPRSTRFHHIRLGFDLNQLRPIPKPAARKQLGLPEDKTLIGFGAESLGNHRKGFDLLIDALSGMPDQKDVQCVVFGAADDWSDSDSQIPSCHQMGYVNDVERMTQIYSACDFVVVPSREDNQPQVGLEAMACGTPVIGFNCGGISEYITHGTTGFLAEPEDSKALAFQISEMVSAGSLRDEMGRRCRQRMEQDFNIVNQSQKYLALYSELLEGREAKSA